MNIEINNNLYKDIKEYCKVNELELKSFINKTLKDAFMVLKYGDRPFVAEKVKETPKEEKIEPLIVETKPKISEIEIKEEENEEKDNKIPEIEEKTVNLKKPKKRKL